MNADTGRIAPFASLGVLPLILRLLRSDTAPESLLARMFLTPGTTLAITAFVFQDVLDFGTTGVDSFVPNRLFVLVVAVAAEPVETVARERLPTPVLARR